MPKKYESADVEEKWYQEWEAQGCFAGDESSEAKPFVIVIPPPNVTGKLHIGHALNNTIQDVLIRHKRMQGFNAVWIPGMDHAGIATQNKVQSKLIEEGTSRQELGREKFIERTWQWKEEYGGQIIRQLRRLGASCDWERERFTMDEGLSEAVQEMFVRLYDKGLIYQGDYIVNWSPGLHTALSDDEVEYKDTAGKLYHIRYPVQGGKEKEFVEVATTRPETLLGDVAVAIHPRDERYKDLSNKKVILPIVERELVVIEDDFVDPEFGTGVVKVTPAHDPNDFAMGQRHDLSPINVMHEDGTMNEHCGVYAGMDRFECRKKIVEDLDAAGLLVKVEEHQHAVGYCYRSGVVIEPRLSRQWFVKMKPLAQMAIEAVESGEVSFVPDRWTKVYMRWMENIRDWCISRQLWWGHRIPVYYCDSTGEMWASKEPPTQSPSGATDIRQDEDVLDTWFSSALWPFSVHGWPHETKALETFYPSTVLATAPDIIFFWVARMVMMGKEVMGKAPFSQVYLHGIVRDEQGNKQSKSLGNALDPIEIIEQYSADALRFTIIMLNATGQDVYLSTERFEIGRNFSTKIWNAARFINMYTDTLPERVDILELDPALLSYDDKHILFHLNESIEKCNLALEKFRFNDYASTLYDFIWHRLCDWYVEYAKQALQGDDAQRKQQSLTLLHHVFSQSLRLLHPLMPFLTEELWHQMGYATKTGGFLIRASWPAHKDEDAMAEQGVTEEEVAYVEAKQDMIRQFRQLRKDYNLTTNKEVQAVIKPSTPKINQALHEDRNALEALLRVTTLTIDSDFTPGSATPVAVGKAGHIFMPVSGLVDVEAEKTRLQKQLDEVNGHIIRVNKKLANEQFISKAPEEVVDTQRALKEKLESEKSKLTQLVQALTETEKK